MKFEMPDIAFEGEMNEFLVLVEVSKRVQKVLGASDKPDIADGRSYTLDSHQTWADEDAPDDA